MAVLNARTSDPYTSKLSASDIREQTRRDRAKVLLTFILAQPRPLADFELEAALGGALNGKWRKRRSDLVRDGLLVAVGHIVNPATRKEVIRWALLRPIDPTRWRLAGTA